MSKPLYCSLHIATLHIALMPVNASFTIWTPYLNLSFNWKKTQISLNILKTTNIQLPWFRSEVKELFDEPKTMKSVDDMLGAKIKCKEHPFTGFAFGVTPHKEFTETSCILTLLHFVELHRSFALDHRKGSVSSFCKTKIIKGTFATPLIYTILLIEFFSCET